MTHRLRYAARTDRGLLRTNNQDSVYAGERLLVVADGMGGHAAGDVASRLVVAAFVPLDESPPGDDILGTLHAAIEDGNAAISEVVAENPDLAGMGTTVDALLFDGPRVGLAHVGDSRGYLFRGGVLHQLTHDDTFVQSLIDDGRITQEEADHHPQRSLILKALNGTPVDPTLTLREAHVGDRYLLCSDGLSGVVSAEAIADALAGDDPGTVADSLIELALVGGGPDNVTVIVADVLEVGSTDTVPVALAADPEGDPEATGPILPIHMTQRMPRIALPADSPGAGADARPGAGAIPGGIPGGTTDGDGDGDGDDGDGADGAGDPARTVSPPPRTLRRAAYGLAVLVLLAVVLGGSVLWARSQFFVGQSAGEVVIYRGVNGSLLGLHFASVQENSCPAAAATCVPLRVVDLVPAARDQVASGIPASNLADARAVVARLSGQMLPLCPRPGETTPPAPTEPTSPSPQTTPPTSPHTTAPTVPTTVPTTGPKTEPSHAGDRTEPTVVTTVRVTVTGDTADPDPATSGTLRLRAPGAAVTEGTAHPSTPGRDATPKKDATPRSDAERTHPSTPVTRTVTETVTVPPPVTSSPGTPLPTPTPVPGVTCREAG